MSDVFEEMIAADRDESAADPPILCVQSKCENSQELSARGARDAEIEALKLPMPFIDETEDGVRFLANANQFPAGISTVEEAVEFINARTAPIFSNHNPLIKKARALGSDNGWRAP